MGKERRVYKVSVGKPERKRQLGRQGRRWKDEIRFCRREIGWEVWSEISWLRTGTGGGLL
jgi:hypothetical protein